MMWYAMQLAERKVEGPRAADIVSTLIRADADGHRLSEAEFGMFVVTLAIAGNETTRNSITQGMMAFTDHPDQWELFKPSGPPPRRRDDPVGDTGHRFQRTAIKDTVLGGVPTARGQRVGMFYSSANFDEEVFEDP